MIEGGNNTNTYIGVTGNKEKEADCQRTTMSSFDLKLLGFDRSWSITAIKFFDNVRFLTHISYLMQHDAFHHLKKLEIFITENNLNWIHDTEQGREFVKQIEQVELNEVLRIIGVSINIHAFQHFYALQEIEFSVNIEDLSVLSTLPHLKLLKSRSCIIPDGGIDLKSFTTLTSLQLSGTYGLRYLNSSLESLFQLKELVIECCDDCNLKLNSLSCLFQLEILSLSCYSSDKSTQIQGGLSALSNLSLLKSLSLDRCHISGSLECLSKLSKHLKRLRLEFCSNIFGDVSDLTPFLKLKELIFDEVNIGGEISELSSLTKLEHILFCNVSDELKGDLNHFLLSLPHLNTFFLQHSNLCGNLSCLANITKLSNLSLEHCENISGELSELSRLTNLSFLSLDDCPQIYGKTSSLTKILNEVGYHNCNVDVNEIIYGENIIQDYVLPIIE